MSNSHRLVQLGQGRQVAPVTAHEFIGNATPNCLHRSYEWINQKLQKFKISNWNTADDLLNMNMIAAEYDEQVRAWLSIRIILYDDIIMRN